MEKQEKYKYFNINTIGDSIRCKIYFSDIMELQKIVLFGHGFGGHKDNQAAAKFAKRVLEKNRDTAVMTFNWPCHGDDNRESLRLEDCNSYLREVISYVKGRSASAELYAYATSFGGYLFLKYISEEENPFRKIALRCPAVNMYDVLIKAIMTDENREDIKEGRPALVGFDRKVKITKELIENLKQEDIMEKDFLKMAKGILILHGTEDEIVPIEPIKAFAGRNGIRFIPMEGADHRFQNPKIMDSAIEKIVSFFGMI